jgi:hypothetical protein
LLGKELRKATLFSQFVHCSESLQRNWNSRCFFITEKELKAARKKLKRQEIANRAAEKELAEISLEQQVLRELRVKQLHKSPDDDCLPKDSAASDGVILEQENIPRTSPSHVVEVSTVYKFVKKSCWHGHTAACDWLSLGLQKLIRI